MLLPDLVLSCACCYQIREKLGLDYMPSWAQFRKHPDLSVAGFDCGFDMGLQGVWMLRALAPIANDDDDDCGSFRCCS
eukprot:3493966-Rhodomonas_salina.3